MSTGRHTGVEAQSNLPMHTQQGQGRHTAGLRDTARAGGQHTWAHRSYRSPMTTSLRNEGEFKHKDAPKVGFKLYFCPRYNCQLKAWIEHQAERQVKSWWGIIMV